MKEKKCDFEVSRVMRRWQQSTSERKQSRTVTYNYVLLKH